ncbi:MAG: hypothetical protein ACOYL3_10355 [Desulfuromonadaceae bacterium]
MEAICKADFDLRVKAYKIADEAMTQAKKEKKSTSGIIVPEIGFHDIYGVWFFGRLKESIRRISLDQFGVKLDEQMHVFVDEEPKKIGNGIHDIKVYGNLCKLYKWIAQGYHRGLVVQADDEAGNSDSEVYWQSGTWSWVLNEDDKARLSQNNSVNRIWEQGT